MVEKVDETKKYVVSKQFFFGSMSKMHLLYYT